MASDDGVILTNDDAAQCKRYAVEKKYWADPYISLMTPKSSAKHAPEISRGYYARVTAMRSLLHKFLKLTDRSCQVVNFGAGSDTNYWLLKELNLNPKSFIELDFQSVTARKVVQIKRQEILLQTIASEDGDIRLSKSEIHGSDYHLVDADLSVLSQVEKKLKESGIDKTMPTLFMSECVLVYIDSHKTKELLKWIADEFPAAMFINYEQVNMADRFGDIMIENLKSRDCFLAGVDACKSLSTQKQRFLDVGWEGADAMDMLQIYKCLPHADVQRIERLEFMDEKELLEQLLGHYCLAWAWKDPNKLGLADLDVT
ncbi:leucine carboxyl methyltransferase 1-like [Crassostrea virginica]|uniref:Leucine carboxyl methyltransferase 1 n=1 Tax=Crassostrea virginica TaxID=6565 RepID=A0A8B8EMK3_CRAVI|nr:leucine carboxyl methyltransferase 1-like [Crassostrea virginica]